MEKQRLEHDLLGKREIPKDAYYGIQTQRALKFSYHRLQYIKNWYWLLLWSKAAALAYEIRIIDKESRCNYPLQMKS